MQVIIIDTDGVSNIEQVTDQTAVGDFVSFAKGLDLNAPLTNNMVIEEAEAPAATGDTIVCDLYKSGAPQGPVTLQVGATVDEVAAQLGLPAGTVRIRSGAASCETVPALGTPNIISSPEKYQGA